MKRKDNCTDVSVYSNKLDEIMPWQVGKGSKFTQKASVPQWVFDKTVFIRACLRGLLQTDGSIYLDRGYTMVNFTNHTKKLVLDTHRLLSIIGYTAHIYQNTNTKNKTKYVVRVSKNTERLLSELRLKKE